MESQLSARTLSKETVSTRLELNQLIPHITDMLELLLGPMVSQLYPPTQSTTHMQYQMHGRGLKTAHYTNHQIPENPAWCKHKALSHT